MYLDSCGQTVVRYTFLLYDNGSARMRHLETTLLVSNQREVLYNVHGHDEAYKVVFERMHLITCNAVAFCP